MFCKDCFARIYILCTECKTPVGTTGTHPDWAQYIVGTPTVEHIIDSAGNSWCEKCAGESIGGEK